MAQLTITSEADAWRLQCPMGHSNISPTNHHWWCGSCARHWEDVDPEFTEARDAKTGEDLHRDDVEFDIEDPRAPA